MNKIEEKLIEFRDYYKLRIFTHEWNDLGIFETNYFNNLKVVDFSARIEFLEIWRKNIGKEVYASDTKFNYVVVEEFNSMDFFNQKYFNTSKSFVFSDVMFDLMSRDYIKYSVDRLTEELLERDLASNSTSKIRNLAFEWQLICKQELIREFKQILE